MSKAAWSSALALAPPPPSSSPNSANFSTPANSPTSLAFPPPNAPKNKLVLSVFLSPFSMIILVSISLLMVLMKSIRFSTLLKAVAVLFSVRKWWKPLLINSLWLLMIQNWSLVSVEAV
uniref:Transmembrane protein n=1 Tax=Medicago truncatula TaxID=3880 RepID=I3SE97_MEDTR|nr:unknown [Medicago truncatula]